MNAKGRLILAGILILGFTAGCAGSYGKMRVADKDVMTVETLVNNWQNYEVYYYGDGNRAIAVLFDPKTDGKTLKMGPRWDRMPDQTTLNKMVGYIKQEPFRGVYGPRLWTVLGPDGSTYGYTYTVLTELLLEVVDEKTMLVVTGD
jgi:hypothetical protein